MYGETIEIQVPYQIERTRLDQFLAHRDLGCSRSRIQQLIADGRITVNERPIKASYIVKSGDRVVVNLPEPVDLHMDPEDIPLDILFEDKGFLVVNKSPGMVVHPAAGVHRGTLVNALLFHCKHLSGINGVLRPGIIHRLDRDTSGLLMVAKDDETHRALAKQFEQRVVLKRYRAFVWGKIETDSGRIEAPVGRHPGDRRRMSVDGIRARYAATELSVEERFQFLSLLSLRLETGRTHQIRVHLSHIRHPVFGDPIYGGREKMLNQISPSLRRRAAELLKLMNRQALHAGELGFFHPQDGRWLQFQAEIPEDMKILWRALT